MFQTHSYIFFISRMQKLACFAFILSAATTVWAYSSGAPTTVCDDMTPKHPFEPQASELPYTVSISKKTLKPGEDTEITISGKEFKGFLVQVRKGDKAVGSFDIDSKDKDSKALTCHGSAKVSLMKCGSIIIYLKGDKQINYKLFLE